MSGSVSFTVKHFAPKILTKYYDFLSNSGFLGKFNKYILDVNEFYDFLVSFEPKLNVRFYLAVASGTIKNSKKSNDLILIDLI